MGDLIPSLHLGHDRHFVSLTFSQREKKIDSVRSVYKIIYILIPDFFFYIRDVEPVMEILNVPGS